MLYSHSPFCPQTCQSASQLYLWANPHHQWHTLVSYQWTHWGKRETNSTRSLLTPKERNKSMLNCRMNIIYWSYSGSWAESQLGVRCSGLQIIMINQVRRLINQGLIKDLISPLLSVDLWNDERAGKKGGAAGNQTQGLRLWSCSRSTVQSTIFARALLVMYYHLVPMAMVAIVVKNGHESRIREHGF